MQHVRIARQHCDHRKLSAKMFGDGLIFGTWNFSRPANGTGSADRVLSTCCGILLAIFACAEHCATTMFVRFRATRSTLQATLLAGRRVGGRVLQEQVAALGSIKLPLTVSGREAFWRELHAMLARLGNRLSADVRRRSWRVCRRAFRR